MAIQRKMSKPPSILNEAGEPEIELEINGLKLSMAPPPAPKGSPGGEAGADSAQQV